MNNSVYLDHNATTPVDPRVLQKMLPFFTENYANPSSASHIAGRRARDVVERSRATIAAGIGAQPEEIVFTSGATEANNTVICGVLNASCVPRGHIISVKTEHHAVLRPIAAMRERGHDYTLLSVAPHGRSDAGTINLNEFVAAIRPDTKLVSVMLGNNVIGTIQPLQQISKICRERGILLHSDATQAVGKIPVDVQNLGLDFMSVSAHKMYGPKGVGALFIRNGRAKELMTPLIYGGRQERGIRGGTLNVPGIVGLAEALKISIDEMPSERRRIKKLRDSFAKNIIAAFPGTEIVGPDLSCDEIRLPNNLNVLIPRIRSAELMAELTDVCVSNGSACVSDSTEPSHVLVFLELSNEEARSCIRFGFGRFNTDDELAYALNHLQSRVRLLQEKQPAERLVVV